jgi:hypothetical protein
MFCVMHLAFNVLTSIGDPKKDKRAITKKNVLRKFTRKKLS